MNQKEESRRETNAVERKSCWRKSGENIEDESRLEGTEGEKCNEET